MALRIHGSSIALAARVWAPAEAERHYLATPLMDALGDGAKRYRALLMAKARTLRSDEWNSNTLWALAQYTHEPRFPVRNLNFGDGMNMLLVPSVPVAHVSTLARPQSWGYFLVGRIGGLSWAWWFPSFFCFTSLFLLLRTVFRGEVLLPALGAFWFCASAYVVLWSNWPAYDVGFGSLFALSTYHVLASDRLRTRLLAALGLAVALSATATRMYPPWSIPTMYAFLAIVVGLVVRERLWRRLTVARLAAPVAIVVVFTSVVVGSFLMSTWPDLKVLNETVYPGARRAAGGDFPLFRLLAGFYNFKTIFAPPPLLLNGSEAAGFFIFLPTVVLAVIASPRVRRGMDAVGWSVLVGALLLTIYVTLGFPRLLANVTLLSRVTGIRCQLAIGVLSIVATLYLLRRTPESRPAPRRVTVARWLFVVGGSAVIYLWQGSVLQDTARAFPANRAWLVPLVSLAVTAGAALLYLRRTRLFAGLLVAALVGTAGHYNPLSRKYPSIERSELRQAVRTVLAQEGGPERPIWAVTGGPPGTVVGNVLAVMGGRTLTGTFLAPQLSLWKRLDPEGKHNHVYNRYAEIYFWHLPSGNEEIRFSLPSYAHFNIHAAPDNPTLLAAGVKYALTFAGDHQLRSPPHTIMYRGGQHLPFTVWRMEP